MIGLRHGPIYVGILFNCRSPFWQAGANDSISPSQQVIDLSDVDSVESRHCMCSSHIHMMARKDPTSQSFEATSRSLIVVRALPAIPDRLDARAFRKRHANALTETYRSSPRRSSRFL